jgi:hypothetical protein
MCGKSVSVDIATYINGVQLKNDFIKVSNMLRLLPKPVANGQTKQMLDVTGLYYWSIKSVRLL